jgi:hypothetical protein
MGTTDESNDMLYRQFDVERRYDDPSAYDESASWFGDGKWPPDWDERREAVRHRDDGRCRRCGRPATWRETVHTHHLTPLSEGGHNDLSNLVTLCGPCHALCHPDVDELDSNPRAAPRFPAADAPDAVALVRQMPWIPGEYPQCRQLELLELVTTDPSATELAGWETRAADDGLESATASSPYDLPPDVARRLPEEMPAVRSEYGLLADEGEQVLVVGAVEKRTEERAAGATIAVETAEQDLRHVDHTTPGVARVTLPAEADQATVWVDHGAPLSAATVDLDGDRPTAYLTKFHDSPPEMAPPWRERRQGETSYDPHDLDRVATTRQAVESSPPDPGGGVVLSLVCGVGLFFAATSLHPLFWLLYAVAGLFGAMFLAELVAGDDG